MIGFDQPFTFPGEFGLEEFGPFLSGPTPQRVDMPVEVAPGVIGTFSDPLPPASFPSSTLPTAVNVELFQTPPPSVPISLWRLEKLAVGRARMELGDDYALFFNESAREVLIENRATQTETRIFGNAQVEVNGEELFQFWGTTSFELANGTKITANTVKVPDNRQAYMLDKLTITDETHAVIVTGLNDLVVGDLAAHVVADPVMHAPVTVVEALAIAPPQAAVAPPIIFDTAVVTSGSSAAAILTAICSETNMSPMDDIASSIEPIALTQPDPTPVSTLPESAPVELASPEPETEPVEISPPQPALQATDAIAPAAITCKVEGSVFVAIETPSAAEAVATTLEQAGPIVSTLTSAIAPITFGPAQAKIEQLPAAMPSTAISSPAPTTEQTAKAEEAAWIVDEDVRDGFVLKEAANGKGWLVEDESHVATQLDLNETAIGADFGPGSQLMSQGEFGIFYNRVFSQQLAISFANLVRTNTIENTAHDHYRDDRDKASDKANMQRRLALGLDQAHQFMMVGLEEFALKEARCA